MLREVRAGMRPMKRPHTHLGGWQHRMKISEHSPPRTLRRRSRSSMRTPGGWRSARARRPDPGRAVGESVGYHRLRRRRHLRPFQPARSLCIPMHPGRSERGSRKPLSHNWDGVEDLSASPRATLKWLLESPSSADTTPRTSTGGNWHAPGSSVMSLPPTSRPGSPSRRSGPTTARILLLARKGRRVHAGLRQPLPGSPSVLLRSRQEHPGICQASGSEGRGSGRHGSCFLRF